MASHKGIFYQLKILHMLPNLAWQVRDVEFGRVKCTKLHGRSGTLFRYPNHVVHIPAKQSTHLDKVQ